MFSFLRNEYTRGPNVPALIFLGRSVLAADFSMKACNDARLSYREYSTSMNLLRVSLSPMLLRNCIAEIANRTLTQYHYHRGTRLKCREEFFLVFATYDPT